MDRCARREECNQSAQSGCHSVDYNIQTKTLTEWNVGCEKCHGPGSDSCAPAFTVQYPQPGSPRHDSVDKRLPPVSFSGPAPRQSHRRRVLRLAGFVAGRDRKNYWRLEEHKPGEQSFTHFAEGTAHKNRMQGNDFVGARCTLTASAAIAAMMRTEPGPMRTC